MREMLTYKVLFQKPQTVRDLIGMSLAEFDSFYVVFKRAHEMRLETSQNTCRGGRRKRRVGAGRKYKFDLRDRLLMTLFWLNTYTTYDVLGSLYGLDKTSVKDNLAPILETLDCMEEFAYEPPSAGRKKLHSIFEVKTLVKLCG